MKLFRSFAIAAAICAGALASMAQGIDFMPEGATLNEAVAKAKTEGKLVFLDCYTSWCGPCKYMSSKIFTTEEVGNFMNPSYVAIKIDMEKGEGPDLARRLEVAAYPTFVIFNGEGNEVGRFMGSSKADEFIENVKKASVDLGLTDLQRRYDNGVRDREFLLSYIDVLSRMQKRRKAVEVAEVLLNDRAETFASDPVLVKIFMDNIGNPFHPAFIYTAKHPEALQAAIGERNANTRIRNVWERSILSLVKEQDGQVTFDNDKFTRLIDLMKECGVNNVERYRYTGLINYARRAGNWGDYVKYVESYAADPQMQMDDMTLSQFAKPVLENCKDSAPRQGMKTLIDKRLEDIRSGKRQPQTHWGQRELNPIPMETLEGYSKELAAPVNS
ncbi:MAG: thioredoxin family protein [Duncaniella sp.]|nr:thioredoxin family protein [Duncaniella sp.]